MPAIKEEVEILPGGILQLHTHNLPEHTKISGMAILELPDREKSSPSPLKSMIGSGSGIFSSPNDVDHFIRNERNAWN